MSKRKNSTLDEFSFSFYLSLFYLSFTVYIRKTKFLKFPSCKLSWQGKNEGNQKTQMGWPFLFVCSSDICQ